MSLTLSLQTPGFTQARMCQKTSTELMLIKDVFWRRDGDSEHATLALVQVQEENYDLLALHTLDSTLLRQNYDRKARCVITLWQEGVKLCCDEHLKGKRNWQEIELFLTRRSSCIRLQVLFAFTHFSSLKRYTFCEAVFLTDKRRTWTLTHSRCTEWVQSPLITVQSSVFSDLPRNGQRTMWGQSPGLPLLKALRRLQRRCTDENQISRSYPHNFRPPLNSRWNSLFSAPHETWERSSKKTTSYSAKNPQLCCALVPSRKLYGNHSAWPCLWFGHPDVFNKRAQNTNCLLSCDPKTKASPRREWKVSHIGDQWYCALSDFLETWIFWLSFLKQKPVQNVPQKLLSLGTWFWRSGLLFYWNTLADFRVFLCCTVRAWIQMAHSLQINTWGISYGLFKMALLHAAVADNCVVIFFSDNQLFF